MHSRLRNTVTWLLGHVPLLAVVAVFGVLAMWGYANEWKTPKFSALWAEEAKPKDKPKPAEAPEADPKDWCGKHGLPDSQCTACHPEIAIKGEPPPDDGPRVAREPADKAETCATHLLTVTFPSAAAVAQSGVRLASVTERPMTQFIDAIGTIDYIPDRLARLSARTPGTIWRVDKHLGDKVRKGDVLAWIDAAEVGKAKAEYLQSVALLDLKSKNYERMRKVPAAMSERQMLEAETAVREARIRLFNARQALTNLGLPVSADALTGMSEADMASELPFLGIPKEARSGLSGDNIPATLLPIVAPFDGVVATRSAVRGEVVDRPKVLFTVADVSEMHIDLDVKPEDAQRLKVGQKVTFLPNGADQAITGELHWISTEVDEKTRTVQAHADIPNPDGQLRANAFGTGRVQIRRAPKAIVVPNEAIQWEGCHHMVFVRKNDETFQVRKVRLGIRSENFTEILAGVLPGEVVATAGSHMLKSEIFKSRIGADD